jgi:hypothetical protein
VKGVLGFFSSKVVKLEEGTNRQGKDQSVCLEYLVKVEFELLNLLII